MGTSRFLEQYCPDSARSICRPADLPDSDLTQAFEPPARQQTITQADDGRTIELRGRKVQIAGVDPRSYWYRVARPERLADPEADLRILLCHYPGVVDRLPAGAFHLVLSGHLHSGQITIPYGFGRLRLAHLRPGYFEGLYVRPAATLHVSPGLGTTFVPFRFGARPEATELILESA
jgi:predicted MPP superfamily phosphohydrolase